MNRKNRTDLLILSSVSALLLLATVGVVLRFGQTGRQTAPQESRRLQTWREQLNILVRQKRFAEAEIVANRILKIQPDDVEMLRTAGNICYRNGKYKEARRLLHRVLVMEPDNITDRCNYALALAGTGRNGQALAELRRVYQASGNERFIHRLFESIAARSSYEGEPLDPVASESAAPEEVFEIPPQKGKKK